MIFTEKEAREVQDCLQRLYATALWRGKCAAESEQNQNGMHTSFHPYNAIPPGFRPEDRVVPELPYANGSAAAQRKNTNTSSRAAGLGLVDDSYPPAPLPPECLLNVGNYNNSIEERKSRLASAGTNAAGIPLEHEYSASNVRGATFHASLGALGGHVGRGTTPGQDDMFAPPDYLAMNLAANADAAAAPEQHMMWGPAGATSTSAALQQPYWFSGQDYDAGWRDHPLWASTSVYDDSTGTGAMNPNLQPAFRLLSSSSTGVSRSVSTAPAAEHHEQTYSGKSMLNGGNGTTAGSVDPRHVDPRPPQHKGASSSKSGMLSRCASAPKSSSADNASRTGEEGGSLVNNKNRTSDSKNKPKLSDNPCSRTSSYPARGGQPAKDVTHYTASNGCNNYEGVTTGSQKSHQQYNTSTSKAGGASSSVGDPPSNSVDESETTGGKDDLLDKTRSRTAWATSTKGSMNSAITSKGLSRSTSQLNTTSKSNETGGKAGPKSPGMTRYPPPSTTNSDQKVCSVVRRTSAGSSAESRSVIDQSATDNSRGGKKTRITSATSKTRYY
ncbi:unnamed protein product [Amoebophrya sp. A25]|nr:unnamed protein product [Amoebophrya sp. A25]|eukprot:GSA25T00027272001.1